MNQVVVRFQNAQILKGQTLDFIPTKDRFHLLVVGAVPGTKPLEILMDQLKAVFFVRSLSGGDPRQKKVNEIDPGQQVQGKKIRITFNDGEVMLGMTQGFLPGRPGFFVVPVDKNSNNLRCFVVVSATQEIALL